MPRYDYGHRPHPIPRRLRFEDRRKTFGELIEPVPAVWRLSAAAGPWTSGGRITQVAATHPTLRKARVDGGYRKHLIEHATALGVDLEIIARTPGTRDFTRIPKRWTVERTHGWLMLHRRLASEDTIS